MANPEHLAILKQGVEQWNQWRDNIRRMARPKRGRPGTQTLRVRDRSRWTSRGDFAGANLREANLRSGEMNLAGAISLVQTWMVLTSVARI